MSKTRVYELAREIGVDNKTLLARVRDEIPDVTVENHLTSLNPEDEERIRALFAKPREGEVVERRIRPTVIRRRAARGSEKRRAKAEPDPTPEPTEEAPAEAATPGEPAPSKEAEVVTPVAEAATPPAETAAETPRPKRRAAPKARIVRRAPKEAEPPAEVLEETPPDVAPVEVKQEEGEIPSDVSSPSAKADSAAAAEVSDPGAPRVAAEEGASAAEPTAGESPGERVEAGAPEEALSAEATPESMEDEGADLESDPRKPARRQGPLYADAEITARAPQTEGQRAKVLSRISIQPEPPRPERPRAPRRVGPPSGAPDPFPTPRPGPDGVLPPGAPLGPPPDKEPRRKRGKRVYDHRRDSGGPRSRFEGDAAGFARAGRKRRKQKGQRRPAQTTPQTVPKAAKRVVRMGEVITVGDFAQALSVKASEIITKLMELGVMATINQTFDFDTATIIAQEYDFTVESVAFEEKQYIEHEEDASEDLVSRAPVVTIMGHVDHGKTSLLDAIQNTRIVDKESGGITQHIGAYTVDLDGGRITFVDTPGHEAFTAMRARGAQVTDIVILVVAADDGIMPQTKEAINHARAANVPIVVAINKIDKDNADPERVRQTLTEFNLVPEEWGGENIFVDISAKEHKGIDRLLELLLLQAEMLELTANPDKRARGVVVESKLDPRRGPVATLLVQEGTLRPGDAVVCGAVHGRVRQMLDDRVQPIESAGPSTPVEVTGWADVLSASDIFDVVTDDKNARAVADYRAQKERETRLAASARPSLENLFGDIKAGELKELKIILKADAQGSIEAIRNALNNLSHEEVEIRVLHGAVGGISENDVNLASASAAIIVGFNVRPEANAKALAEQEHVDIKLYSIIYDAVEDIKAAVTGMLAPTKEEVIHGHAEVRELFQIPKTGTVAGVMVIDGKVVRGSAVRLVRDNVVIWEGKMSTLRRFKDDAKEVREGFECGIGLENYNDVKTGDVIESFEVQYKAATG